MAIKTVTYPNGVSRKKYITLKKVPAEQTYGKKKQNAFANRVYYKPSLKKLVIRHPGVFRESENVKKINSVLEGLRGTPEHPSFKCGGTNWRERITCLKKEMKEIVKPIAEVI
jgi:hypothetical protein